MVKLGGDMMLIFITIDFKLLVKTN